MNSEVKMIGKKAKLILFGMIFLLLCFQSRAQDNFDKKLKNAWMGNKGMLNDSLIKLPCSLFFLETKEYGMYCSDTKEVTYHGTWKIEEQTLFLNKNNVIEKYKILQRTETEMTVETMMGKSKWTLYLKKQN